MANSFTTKCTFTDRKKTVRILMVTRDLVMTLSCDSLIYSGDKSVLLAIPPVNPGCMQMNHWLYMDTKTRNVVHCAVICKIDATMHNSDCERYA